MGRPTRRPRRLIVDRGLQFNLVTRTVMLVLFVFCLIGAVLFSPLVRQVTGAADPDSLAMAEALLFMQQRFWPVAILSLVVAILGAVFTSHRIAGPLVRVKRIMRAVGRGQLPPQLATRPGDFFHPEVEVLNEMVRGLTDRVQAVRQKKLEVDQALAAHAASAGDPSDREVRESLDRLKAKSKALQDALDRFVEQDVPDPEAARARDDSRCLAAVGQDA